VLTGSLFCHGGERCITSLIISHPPRNQTTIIRCVQHKLFFCLLVPFTDEVKTSLHFTMAPILTPFFTPSTTPEAPQFQSLISALHLEPHIEGGYFTETDRAKDTVPSPFSFSKSTTIDLAPQRPGFNPAIRNSSTTIFYLLTPHGPQVSHTPILVFVAKFSESLFFLRIRLF
jgi:hypothetical protein